LIKEYNGFIPFGTSGRVYFKDRLDVNKAIQWLESVKISLLLK